MRGAATGPRDPGPAGPISSRLLTSEASNAISLPGRVYITQGLYRRLKSDEDLAAVLAHEFAHLAAKDHFKPRCASALETLQREAVADCRGAEYLREAGLDPRAMLEVIHLVREHQPEGWSDTRMRVLVRELETVD